MEGMPHRDTVHSWLAQDEKFSDNYVRACKMRREYKFETLEEIVDTEEDVYKARLKIDVIKWQLSKEDPKKYGDKIDHTTNGKDLPQPILGVQVVTDGINEPRKTILDVENSELI